MCWNAKECHDWGKNNLFLTCPCANRLWSANLKRNNSCICFFGHYECDSISNSFAKHRFRFIHWFYKTFNFEFHIDKIEKLVRPFFLPIFGVEPLNSVVGLHYSVAASHILAFFNQLELSNHILCHCWHLQNRHVFLADDVFCCND